MSDSTDRTDSTDTQDRELINEDYYSTLTPAYGRDYKNKAELESAFRAGKDFTLNRLDQGKYCSIRDFAKGTKVLFQYGRGLKNAVITV